MLAPEAGITPLTRQLLLLIPLFLCCRKAEKLLDIIVQIADQIVGNAVVFDGDKASVFIGFTERGDESGFFFRAALRESGKVDNRDR